DLEAVARASGTLELMGAPEGFDALAMADIARARGGLTAFIARDGARAQAFTEALGFFAPDIDVVLFPSWDCLPYDRMGPSQGVAARRMAVLTRLARGEAGAARPLLIVVPEAALLQRVAPRAMLERAGYAATVGQDVDLSALERYFAVNGYVRASTV